MQPILFFLLHVFLLLLSSCVTNERNENVEFFLTVKPISSESSYQEICITLKNLSSDTIVWLQPKGNEIDISGIDTSFILGVNEIPVDLLIDVTKVPSPPIYSDSMRAKLQDRMQYNCFVTKLKELNEAIIENDNLFQLVCKRWMIDSIECCSFFYDDIRVIEPNETYSFVIGYVYGSQTLENKLQANYHSKGENQLFVDTLLVDLDTLLIKLPSQENLSYCYGFRKVETPRQFSLKSRH